MSKIRQVIEHPAGKVGITIGLILGIMAAAAGQVRRVLFVAGLCRLLALRFTPRKG